MLESRDLSALRTSARLTIKINRFEIATGALVAIVIGIAALVVRAQLESVGVGQDCLLRWMTSLTTAADCDARVQAWAVLNEGSAGKVMASMAALPLIVGLLAGVPIVGRELESGTAAFAWALVGSRWRWLGRQTAPIVILVVVVSTTAAIPAALLADTRSASGVWSSTFADADLFGVPVVARTVAATAVGILCGAMLGRMLPALIISFVLAGAITLGLGAVEPLVVHATYNQLNVGCPGCVADFITSNPDIDVRFVTKDDQVLSLETAVATAPPGTTDLITWVQDHYRMVTFGVKGTKTVEWQIVQTAILMIVCGACFGASMLVVHRRSPR